jgi:SAM-dependent methyltransferase
MGFSNLITNAVDTVLPDLRQRSPRVIELGNQTLKNNKARNTIYAKYGITPPGKIDSTKDWYLSVGFSSYLAVDVNTERDAVAFDLNLDISKEYDFTEQFDLVTNNGTGEHVFNQYMVFKNAHDLCRVGGYMIHVLPFYRWVDHGFYSYHPNLFPCLANQNNYELLHLWIATSDADTVCKLDVNNLSRHKGYRDEFNLDTWKRDPMVAAVMKKTVDKKFESPIQYLYGGDNISSDEIGDRYR